jgi:hypothetical protein
MSSVDFPSVLDCRPTPNARKTHAIIIAIMTKKTIIMIGPKIMPYHGGEAP